MSGIVLTTERLVLRPFTRRDVSHLHALWTDPDVRRFLWDDRVIDRATAAEVVEASIAGFLDTGFGFWTVQTRSSGEPVGFAGLREFGDAAEVELLYGLWPGAWGGGFATEAARAVLAYGFRDCGLARILAGADEPNRASIAVMERLGMRFESCRVIDGLEARYYEIDTAAFRARAGSRRAITSRRTRKPTPGVRDRAAD